MDNDIPKVEVISAEVISVYTDEQAIEDGILIPITPLRLNTPAGKPIMRMTRSFWYEIISKQIELDLENPLPGIRAAVNQIRNKIIPALDDTAEPGEPRDYLYSAELDGLPVIWCIDNGYEQFTIMLRSDY